MEKIERKGQAEWEAYKTASEICHKARIAYEKARSAVVAAWAAYDKATEKEE